MERLESNIIETMTGTPIEIEKYPHLQPFKILGTGASIPSRRVTNEEIETQWGIEPGWIITRTGISERRFATQEESTLSLAVASGKQALSESRIEPSQVGLVIVATSTPDRLAPSTAGSVLHSLGIEKAMAFDVSAGCSGFLYSLKIASSLLHNQKNPYALVIGVETFSKHLDLNDKKTSAVFGDGSGAVVLKRNDKYQMKLDPFHFVTATDVSQDLSIGPMDAFKVNNHFVNMNGREVFKKAVSQIGDSIVDLIQSLNLSKESFRHMIIHQANQRILNSVQERFHISKNQIPSNIGRYGNTGAASIPILLNELKSNGQIDDGDLILFSAFGAGYSWGSSAFIW